MWMNPEGIHKQILEEPTKETKIDSKGILEEALKD